MCPCPTLQVRGCPPPSHGWGQDGSLFLLLYDSLIHYFTPVYPDAIQINYLPHRGSQAAPRTLWADSAPKTGSPGSVSNPICFSTEA
jgi:hypothetical protein